MVGATNEPRGPSARTRDAFTSEDVEIDLVPTGRLTGSGSVDLSGADQVPYGFSLRVSEGDFGAVSELFGIDPGGVSGAVDLTGRFAGTMRPQQPFVRSLDGHLTIAATQGTLKRGIPPVVRVALSSDALNPFESRERVRFERLDTTFAFDAAVMRTDSFLIDGPDARVFASGKIDFNPPTPTIDAEVAVFLFRVIERAIEKIPIVSRLLLGDDDSFLAAYYELDGELKDPDATLFPMRTLASGPASLLLERLPRFLQRSFEAIGSALRGEGAPESPRPLVPGEPSTS